MKLHPAESYHVLLTQDTHIVAYNEAEATKENLGLHQTI
jgi:hypothetical protein